MRPLLTTDGRDQRVLRRPAQVGAALVTMLAAATLTAATANAAPCTGLGSPGGISCSGSKPGGSTGGGGGAPADGGAGGGGTSAGGIPPVGLTDDQAVEAIAGPPGAAQTPPAPAAPTIVLAQTVASTAQLPVPTVHTAPAGKTYVRVSTSLWVDGFVTVQTAPITIDGQTIQATATPKSVDWNLGETKLSCDDGGSKASKTCHYTYERSSAGQDGGAYKITATIVWGVTWTCAGANCDDDAGTLPDKTMSSAPTALVVGEIQTNSQQ